MKHVTEKKYIQTEKGNHCVMIFIAGMWYCPKSLLETIDDLEKGYPVWLGGGLKNPITKYLIEQGIFIKYEKTPIIIGNNKEAIIKFKNELKDAILPIIMSQSLGARIAANDGCMCSVLPRTYSDSKHRS